ncbi:hypothetical protein Nepgr_017695 [Nepenthes gracilis]|uniref:Protein kinase domain-containing protein n=1 Tax=Nepenthes gracilis TaxID=150966 RepID=A0AAD3XTC5_NEPGR|nr:hypothetical protein Nepgr_017695 [Nepenthes gracilis]
MSCGCFGSFALQRKNGHSHVAGEIAGLSLENIGHFSYNELRAATDNFHLTNKIGRGGFGTVYKGILKGGVQVAVKTLSAESKQGVREFLTEIKIIANVRHPNLVALIGCCAEGDNRILVYEYIENRSLDRVLLGRNSDQVKLQWERRSAICLGTARGLTYLHEELVPRIVHRDIKASNILLDNDFLPKIGDFGLAKLFPDNITHISTRIAGTIGYLAPEYALGGHLTTKADIYSFGVLILEVVSGRSSSNPRWGRNHKLLLQWAWELYEEGSVLELVDPVLKNYPEEEVVRYITVALFCTQAAANRRPPMSKVVEMLLRTTQLNEKELTAPGFFSGSRGSSMRKASTGSTSSQIQSVSGPPERHSSDPKMNTKICKTLCK